MKKFLLIKSILLFVIGVLIIFLTPQFVEHLRFCVSAIMMIYGVLEIVHAILNDKHFYEYYSFYYGAVETFLGLATIIFVKDFVVVCVIWAVWSILRETFEIMAVASGEEKGVLAVLSMIETAVVFTLSVEMLANPGEHSALTHTYLLIVELFLTSGTILFETFFEKRKEKIEHE